MRRPAWAGAFVAVGVFAAFMVGAGRAFGYDASVTMHSFVTGSIGDVFGHQIVFNNHPLISFVEHEVWLVTGSSSETTMRVAPALFAAIAAGLLTWRIAAAWGLAAGLAAGIVFAAHPTIAGQRDVRGYTLAALAIVVMGIAVLDVDWPALFAVALGVGIGAHFYAAVPAFALVVYLWADGRLTRRWRVAIGSGLLIGFACYVGMLGELGGNDSTRVFRPTFPIGATWELLGGGVVAVGCLGLLLVVAARTHPPRKAVLAAAALAPGILIPWIVAPNDLYTRFVYFAAPALALAVAAAVRTDRRLALVAIVGAVAMVVPAAGSWTKDELANRELARAVPGQACGVGYPIEALRWYKPDIEEGEGCQVAAILAPERVPDAVSQAAQRWPVVCWEVAGAQVRATSQGACPAATPSG